VIGWLALSAALLLGAWWVSRRRMNLADTPRSRCAAVFIGFNEITGSVESVEASPAWFTGTMSAWWRSTLEEERVHTRVETTTDSEGRTQTRTVVEHRFETVESFSSAPLIRIADETGRVMVDLTSARLSVPATHIDITRDPKWAEPNDRLPAATTGRYRQQEWTLVDGQPLYIVGAARLDDAGTDVVVDGTGSGEFLVSTRTKARIAAGRRAVSWFLLVAGLAAAVGGPIAVHASPLAVVLGGLGVGAVVVAWGTFELYNRLVRIKQLQERAWSLIDVQLARRATLIPQLVEVVKRYAAHEVGLQQAVASGRAMPATGWLALREAYPQLKADTVFQRLFEELAATENRMAGARDYFNDAVTILRDRTHTFPGILLAARAKDGRFGARELIVAGHEELARPENARGPAEAAP